jgi:glutamate-1-semialdehyde 2,1-aminomutase
VPGTGGLSPGAVAEALILPYDDEGAVETLLKRHRDQVGCVLLDPKAGILPVRPAFARFVRELTRDLDMLMMFDEIVGFRAAHGGLQAQLGIDPDITTFGKLVGGGFAVGAFGGRAELMDRFDNSGPPTGFSQSGTFSAHPVTAAAGLATLQQLTPEAFDHLNGLSQRLGDGLRTVFERRHVTAQYVATGSVFSVHFVEPPLRSYRDLARVDREPGRRLFLSLLLGGQLLSHSMSMNALSLPMQPTHIDALIEAVDDALGD